MTRHMLHERRRDISLISKMKINIFKAHNLHSSTVAFQIIAYLHKWINFIYFRHFLASIAYQGLQVFVFCFVLFSFVFVNKKKKFFFVMNNKNKHFFFNFSVLPSYEKKSRRKKQLYYIATKKQQQKSIIEFCGKNS